MCSSKVLPHKYKGRPTTKQPAAGEGCGVPSLQGIAYKRLAGESQLPEPMLAQQHLHKHAQHLWTEAGSLYPHSAACNSALPATLALGSFLACQAAHALCRP